MRTKTFTSAISYCLICFIVRSYKRSILFAENAVGVAITVNGVSLIENINLEEF